MKLLEAIQGATVGVVTGITGASYAETPEVRYKATVRCGFSRDFNTLDGN